MEYVYDVNVSVVTGRFRERYIGGASLDSIVFSNPVQKGDRVVFDASKYHISTKMGDWGGFIGVVTSITHFIGNNESGKSNYTVYVKIHDRLDYIAGLEVEWLGELSKLIKGERKQKVN